GEIEAGMALPPDRVLSAAFLEHPLTQVHDEAGVLGEGDERASWEQPTRRLLPAHEGLDPFEAAGAEVDLGLVEEPQATVVDRAPQGDLEVVAVVDLGPEIFVEDHDAIAPALLGRVQG